MVSRRRSTRSAAGSDGLQVGLGKVAIILGGLFGSARAGVAVLVKVPGFLDDSATRVQHSTLTPHLVADRDLDDLSELTFLVSVRVPNSAGALGFQRDVGVAAHRALVHPHIGDIQRTQQVAQRGDVGAGDLRCPLGRALDRLGDDLDQRDAGAVVIGQRSGSPSDPAGVAAQVGQLAGVLLHVGALDLHPEGAAVIQRDIEVAIDGDRLVVLRDLVVLRLVRVEVVLPREPAPRRDLAVEREPDSDRRLDGGLVEHRQRTRQAEAHRAHPGVGLGAELVGAAAEHLGGGRQLDVHLQAEHRLVAHEHVVVVEQLRPGRMGSARSRSHAVDPNWLPTRPRHRRRRRCPHRRSAAHDQTRIER